MNMLGRIAIVWFGLAAVLLAGIAFGVAARVPSGGLTDLLLITQDLGVMLGVVAVAAALRLAPGLASSIAGAMTALGSAGVFRSADRRRRLIAVLVLAAVAILIGWIGSGVVFDGYALSMDEFMATFDAVIFEHGDLMAPVAAQWRGYEDALQPLFVLHPAGGAFWVSGYLPVNAGLRALAGTVHAEALMSPVLAGLSIVGVFGVGRRIWPARPEIGVWAAVLLATSSQVLVAAMTPYAMTAHLAFNLVWLWLFLGGGWRGHAAAAVVAFLACGLHQLIFHPLFAAPFVLQLWLERRWRAASFHTLAYAAICAFWIDFGALRLWAANSSSADPGAVGFAAQIASLLEAIHVEAIPLMAKNLVRFVTWQNPLTAPLLILSTVGALREKGTLRSLLLGLVLTTVAMTILEPYQGHGWGYRYLHGLLGSVCLLAAWQWSRLVGPSDGRRARAGAFVAVAAASILVLLPLRAWQAHSVAAPQAAAERAIRGARTQVVLVDEAGVWFGLDFVRNDPYLRNRPLVLEPTALTDAQARALCARYTVTIFDRADAARYGVPTFPPPAGSSWSGSKAAALCPNAVRLPRSG
jgi:hypothetical protein